MNDLITMLQNAEDRTPAQSEAIRVDTELRLHKSMIENGIVGMSYDLKLIRDRSLYKELGYETFESYTEEEHGIKSRQAYKYIRAYEQLGADVLNSSAKLGITKLDLLASLDSGERAEFLSEHTIEELDATSTPEYRELLKKYEKVVEQLSFLPENNDAQSDDPEAAIEIAVEARIEEERSKIAKEAEEKARIEVDESYQAQIEKLQKKVKTEQDKAKQAKAQEENAKIAIENAKKQQAGAEKAKKKAEETYCTVELQPESFKVIQCRARSNSAPPKDVVKWVEKYAERLRTTA